MQTAQCSVRLGGELTSVVDKSNVTAAELGVLRAVHGEGAVIGVVPTGEIAVNNREEKERLAAIYARRDRGKEILERTYPGSNPSLPQTIADAGFGSAAVAEKSAVEKVVLPKAEKDVEKPAEKPSQKNITV